MVDSEHDCVAKGNIGTNIAFGISEDSYEYSSYRMFSSERNPVLATLLHDNR